MSRKSDDALSAFSKGFNCSQAVLSVFADELGLSIEQALKIASPFGAGARMGNICGAVTGALMVLGMREGHCIEGDGETKMALYNLAELFQKKFSEINGSCICRDLLGYDVSSEEDRKIIEQKELFTTICPELVRSSVEIIESL